MTEQAQPNTEDAMEIVRRMLEGILQHMTADGANLGELLRTRNKYFADDILKALEQCYDSIMARRPAAGMSIQVQLAVDPPVAVVLGVITPDMVEPLRDALKALTEAMDGEMVEGAVDLNDDQQ